MKVLVLNQFIPPDPSPTAKLAGEVAELFRSHGHEVRLVAGSTDYRGRGGGMPRPVREATAWLRMLAGALSGPRPGLMVALSSPPCLLVAAALAARLRGARLLHWAMDLYPETAVALGALPRAAAAPLQWMMRWAYGQCAAVAALDDDMAAHLAPWCRQEPEAIPPWPPEAAAAALPARTDRLSGLPEEARVWLYSGNLGRAHLWRPLLEAQALLEARGSAWWLVFQGGGPQWEAAQEAARRLGLRQCLWRPYADEARLVESLLAADVLVATRRPEARGLLWPSKLAVALRLPRPVLWVGEPDSAVARTVREHPGSAAFAAEAAGAMAHWLNQCPRQTLQDADASLPMAMQDAREVLQKAWWAMAMKVAGGTDAPKLTAG